MVQKPKDKGGLGVLNLRLQNYALLLKQLHKFYNKHSTPCVQLIWNKYYAHKVPHAAGALGSFWWRDLLKLCTLYRGIATCTVGDGSSVSFWDDLWSGEILSTKYPWLFSFALNPDVSVNQVMLSDDLDTIFNLPISEPAFTELLDLQQHIQSVAFDHNSKEQWIFYGEIRFIHLGAIIRWSFRIFTRIQSSRRFRSLSALPDLNSLHGSWQWTG